VFILWSLELLPGQIHAIMITLLFFFEMKLSLNARVILLALKGIWVFPSLMALKHSLSANRD